MAATAGRNVRIEYSDDDGATWAVVAGARTDGMTINREAIDITDKDDVGIRTLLPHLGVWSMDMSCDGVLIGTQLLTLAEDAAPTALHDFRITIADIRTYTGKFQIGGFEVGGADGTEAATFSTSFMSSGAVAGS